MVSIIKAGKSLRNTLNYNEQKVRQGKADLFHSGGFGKDTKDLSFSDKLNHLQKIAARNEATAVNSVHITLNFAPNEKLSKEKLCQIAESYLDRIGFAGQPFLAYEHHDAGHPHIHLVTTCIRPDGRRIPLHNIGRNQSETARKAIEKEFSLLPADRRQRQAAHQLRPVVADKVQYGRSETKRAITTVLDHVIPQYKYSSLPELNAVLRTYNIIADQGSKESRVFKSGGLVYRVLDEHGKKVGVPIKASDIYSKPTIKNLQKRFERNEPDKERHKQHIRNAIDLAFSRHTRISITGLVEVLQKDNIQLVIRENQTGTIYGLTYIDHKNKVVFNGSALGKAYSANQVVQRLAQAIHQHNPSDTIPNPKQSIPSNLPQPRSSQKSDTPTTPMSFSTPGNPLSPALPGSSEKDTMPISGSLAKDVLNELTDNNGGSGPAAELRQDERKKRKRKPRL